MLRDTKYNQVKLVFAVFPSAFMYQLTLNYIKQAEYNKYLLLISTSIYR